MSIYVRFSLKNAKSDVRYPSDGKSDRPRAKAGLLIKFELIGFASVPNPSPPATIQTTNILQNIYFCYQIGSHLQFCKQIQDKEQQLGVKLIH